MATPVSLQKYFTNQFRLTTSNYFRIFSVRFICQKVKTSRCRRVRFGLLTGAHKDSRLGRRKRKHPTIVRKNTNMSQHFASWKNDEANILGHARCLECRKTILDMQSILPADKRKNLPRLLPYRKVCALICSPSMKTHSHPELNSTLEICVKISIQAKRQTRAFPRSVNMHRRRITICHQIQKL